MSDILISSQWIDTKLPSHIHQTKRIVGDVYQINIFNVTINVHKKAVIIDILNSSI